MFWRIIFSQSLQSFFRNSCEIIQLYIVYCFKSVYFTLLFLLLCNMYMCGHTIVWYSQWVGIVSANNEHVQWSEWKCRNKLCASELVNLFGVLLNWYKTIKYFILILLFFFRLNSFKSISDLILKNPIINSHAIGGSGGGDSEGRNPPPLFSGTLRICWICTII